MEFQQELELAVYRDALEEIDLLTRVSGTMDPQQVIAEIQAITTVALNPNTEEPLTE